MCQSRAVAAVGYGGGVPPNSGHRAWWLHQPHNLERRGRKSPVRTAVAIVRHKAITPRSNAINSASLGEYSNGSIALVRLYNEALPALPPPVPEPASAALLLGGLVLLGRVAKKRGAC